MSQKKKPNIGIVVRDGYIELSVDGSVFKLSLDERGVPQFPESVKKELPPYMPKEVEKIIGGMRNCRQNETYNLDIVHKFWCEELAGIGICTCDPVLCHSKVLGLGQCGAESWGTFTCVVCHESSNGRTGSDHVTYNGDQLFGKYSVIKDNEEDNDYRFYWAFSDTTLICEECLRNIMAETRIGFPNVIDLPFSPVRADKPVLH
jgi:hypothetical protein